VKSVATARTANGFGHHEKILMVFSSPEVVGQARWRPMTGRLVIRILATAAVFAVAMIAGVALVRVAVATFSSEPPAVEPIELRPATNPVPDSTTTTTPTTPTTSIATDVTVTSSSVPPATAPLVQQPPTPTAPPPPAPVPAPPPPPVDDDDDDERDEPDDDEFDDDEFDDDD
jgi:hypothetical protein